MAQRGMKLLHTSKKDTIIDTYTSGVAVVPDASMLGVYVDMYPEEKRREVEVIERLKELMNYAKEERYNRPIGNTVYYIMDINRGKNAIERQGAPVGILPGTVAICVRGTIISSGVGSLIIDVCFKEIIDKMRETGQLI